MRLLKRTRLAQKRHWRPSLGEIVRRTMRRHSANIVANVMSNNALISRMTRGN